MHLVLFRYMTKLVRIETYIYITIILNQVQVSKSVLQKYELSNFNTATELNVETKLLLVYLRIWKLLRTVWIIGIVDVDDCCNE